ncbi:hypothetical protein CGZ93_17795 [Enemella dayhoffiae]|uniref:Uncharacterized protein n=1 Tax=Enemella dayhoffiae TaxID=2016507 RepID=A0A255GQE7_9ACTN|nr:hypothetical protein [Enemella dayhoffiae]OYO16613.1 hypothetical protein CGZ93_17795 [Enemella dayhoffiae]
MSDRRFSERPFAAGSLVGLRAFRVDGLGRLTGVRYQRVWHPGVNEAECVPRDDSLAMFNLTTIFNPLASIRLSGITGSPAEEKTRTDDEKVLWERPEPELDLPEPPHQLAGMDCTCGFYAYFDGRNDYYSEGITHDLMVSGIIEGYGVCTVGSRGFRASKARLLALIADNPDDLARHAVAYARLRKLYPDVPWYDTEVDAITAHPLSDMLPAPDSPDFWTRS